jgi:hypothetical protein
MIEGVTRRSFLRASLAGLGLAALDAVPLPDIGSIAWADSAPLSRARESLKAMVLKHAAAKDNPWLLLHGIRAIGKGFKVEGEPAVEYMCGRYLKETTVNGKAYLYLPPGDEGHTNAFLSEAILDTGVGTDYRIRWNGRRYTIGDLVASAKGRFSFDPASFDKDDVAWSLIAFAYTTPPDEDTWVNAYGKRIRFSEVVEFGMATLEEATQQLRSAMRQGTMPAQKDWIHNFTCGGTHLIHGLATCLRFGYRQRSFADRMKPQFDLLVWRLEADPHLIDAHYRLAAGQYPGEVARLYHLDAKLKFLGHAFEIINYARLYRLFSPSPAQQKTIIRSRAALVGVIEGVGREEIGKVARDARVLNLLIGDACHAYHGLRMVKGVNQG